MNWTLPTDQPVFLKSGLGNSTIARDSLTSSQPQTEETFVLLRYIYKSIYYQIRWRSRISRRCIFGDIRWHFTLLKIDPWRVTNSTVKLLSRGYFAPGHHHSRWVGSLYYVWPTGASVRKLCRFPSRKSLQQSRHDNTDDLHAWEKRKSYKHCPFLYNTPDTKTCYCSSSMWAYHPTLSYRIEEVFTIIGGWNTLLISDLICFGGTFSSVSGRLTFQIRVGRHQTSTFPIPSKARVVTRWRDTPWFRAIWWDYVFHFFQWFSLQFLFWSWLGSS